MKFAKLFCNHSVCKECGVHYAPWNGLMADLCATHRKPLMDEYLRVERVLMWARANIARVEPMMLEDNKIRAQAQQAWEQMMSGAAQASAGLGGGLASAQSLNIHLGGFK